MRAPCGDLRSGKSTDEEGQFLQRVRRDHVVLQTLVHERDVVLQNAAVGWPPVVLHGGRVKAVERGFSVVLLNWLVPWASRGFGWWLAPPRDLGGRISIAGGLLIIALYAASLFIFSKL